MPKPTDETDKRTLPDPELNPLLNPVLAAHMGRWAEVYFTTPPERRGQAVAELLKELEASSPAPPDSQLLDDGRTWGVAEAEPAHAPAQSAAPSLDSPLPDPAQSVLICSACAHHNQAGHRFCGMCGALLQRENEDFIAAIEPSEAVEPASWAEPRPSLDANSVANATEPEYAFNPARKSHDAVEPAWPVAETQHFAHDVPRFASHVPRFANHVPHFAEEPKPVPYRYRLYVGVSVALLLGILIYMARRGTEVRSGAVESPASRVIPAAQPGAATSEPTATAARPEPVEKAVEKVEKKANPREQPVSSARLPEAGPREPAAPQPTPRTVPVAGNSSTGSVDLSGAEELATAEKYLNGKAGGTRDSREAAQWLWKAVGKGNPAATVALSDLYMRGDGVAKSCDQARLLLDAASRKGVKSAADRLRNLQAFGCQ